MHDMKINDLSCQIHMPKATERKMVDGGEVAQSLPPAAPQKVYCVDEYNCPENWMHGSGIASSYFVGVQEGHGMWLDFNQNARLSHNVAVLISIQGINPITGQQTKVMRLEQYRENCPVHETAFGANRFCEKCGYAWDAQNYLASSSTPSPYLWLDGFKTADGVTRQYIFTKEESKGVAAQLIGNDRVFAIGVSFYKTKEAKPPQPEPNYIGTCGVGAPWVGAVGDIYPMIASSGYDMTYKPGVRHLVSGSSGKGMLRSMSAGGGSTMSSSLSAGSNSAQSPTPAVFGFADSGVQSINSVQPANLIVEAQETLEIGAGAMINQRIYQDNLELTAYQDEPAGLIYINYAPISQVEAIIAMGKKPVRGAEGFLQGLNAAK